MIQFGRLEFIRARRIGTDVDDRMIIMLAWSSGAKPACVVGKLLG